jgi:hypothetical protein
VPTQSFFFGHSQLFAFPACYQLRILIDLNQFLAFMPHAHEDYDRDDRG